MANKTKKDKVSYSLDPFVNRSIRQFAKDSDVDTSSLVNGYLLELINALETAKIETDYEKAKAVFAKNKTILYPGSNRAVWHLCIKLEFDVRE